MKKIGVLAQVVKIERDEPSISSTVNVTFRLVSGAKAMPLEDIFAALSAKEVGLLIQPLYWEGIPKVDDEVIRLRTAEGAVNGDQWERDNV